MTGWTVQGAPLRPGRRRRPSRPPSIPTPSGSFSLTRHIPAWAPAFADATTGNEQQGWQAVKDGRGFALRVACVRAQRTVEYLRKIAPGRAGKVAVTCGCCPGPGGSVIVMTLPLTPGTDPETVTASLRAELAALARLAGTA